MDPITPDQTVPSGIICPPIETCGNTYCVNWRVKEISAIRVIRKSQMEELGKYELKKSENHMVLHLRKDLEEEERMVESLC